MTDEPHEPRSSGSHPSQATLADVPVELLENICGHVIAAEPHPDATAMFALRLTCRAICQKTDRLFCKVAFRRITFYTSFSSAERLVALSRVPRFASEVRTLVVWDQKENVAFGWDEIQERLRDPATATSQARLLEDDECERSQSFFHQNSRLDAVMLSQALVRLQNLQEIEICPLFRPRDDSIAVDGPTTSSMFSTVTACVAASGIKPRSLRVPEGMGRGSGHEAVDLRALLVPEMVLGSMGQLRVLELLLKVPAGHDSGIDAWTASLVNFLRHTPDLETLTLRWDDCDTFGSRKTFHAVARRVRLRHLLSFRLQGFHCDGADLGLFLRKHISLKSLDLQDLDIISENMSYAVILRKAASSLRLDEFRSWQIAQDGFRTRYRNLGGIGWYRSLPKAGEEFLGDWVLVAKPLAYREWIEPWEDVRSRLAELANDVEVTELASTPRTEKELQEWEDAY